jgi:hypothetical protein
MSREEQQQQREARKREALEMRSDRRFQMLLHAEYQIAYQRAVAKYRVMREHEVN